MRYVYPAQANKMPLAFVAVGAAVFCLSVWGCLLCGLSVCLVFVVAGFVGRAVLVLMCAASCFGFVVLGVSAVAV